MTEVSIPDNITMTETAHGTDIKVDIGAPTQAQLDAPTEIQEKFLQHFGEEYAKKSWFADLSKSDDPFSATMKKLDNALDLVGRKSEGLKVPSPDAPQEAWQEIYKALGVPEKADDYKYEAPKPPEGLEQYYQTDEKLLSAMRQAAHQAGVTPQGWQKIASAFDSYYADTLTEAVVQSQVALKATQENFQKHYGERAPQVLSTFDQAITSTPQWAQPVLNALPPEAKSAMASLFNEFASKYVSPDKIDLKDVAGPALAMDETQYSQEYGQAFAKLYSTKPGTPERLQAQRHYDNLRAQAKQVFK